MLALSALAFWPALLRKLLNASLMTSGDTSRLACTIGRALGGRSAVRLRPVAGVLRTAIHSACLLRNQGRLKPSSPNPSTLLTVR